MKCPFCKEEKQLIQIDDEANEDVFYICEECLDSESYTGETYQFL